MTIKRQCARDLVRDLIVSRILDESYPAGTRLKELEIAHECNCSQAPVREALRELEAAGLVQSERYRGTRVRDSSRTELREAYELRALLEERSATRCVPLGEEALATLARSIDQLRTAIRRKDIVSHSEAIIRFHRTIVEASHNRAFLNAWDALQWSVRMRFAVQRGYQARMDMGRLVEAHEDILAALRAANGERAGRLLREYLDFVLPVLADETPPPPARRGRRTAHKQVARDAR